jgi:hypothetical protein
MNVLDPEVEDIYTDVSLICSGVAVGSSIGHMVGGWFNGGSSSEAAQASQDNMAANPDAGSAYASSYAAPKACDGQISQFRTCMDQNEVSFSWRRRIMLYKLPNSMLIEDYLGQPHYLRMVS